MLTVVRVTLWLPIVCILACMVMLSVSTVRDAFTPTDASYVGSLTMDVTYIRVDLLSRLPKTVRIYKNITDNGVPYVVGDMVQVTSKNDADHKAGTYVVVTTGDTFVDVCEATTCTLSSINGTLYRKNGIITTKQKLPVGSTLYFTDLACYAVVDSAKDGQSSCDGAECTGPDILLIKIVKYVSAEERDSDTGHECYENTTILTREACQNQGHVWDKRCTFDFECPFFGRNPSNLRGGCNNGYCEFPTSVNRLGYTKYSCDSDCDTNVSKYVYDDNNIMMGAMYEEPLRS